MAPPPRGHSHSGADVSDLLRKLSREPRRIAVISITTYHHIVARKKRRLLVPQRGRAGMDVTVPAKKARLGAAAIATSSAAVAWMEGYPDGQHISRDLMLQAVARVVRAVRVPVTADLEAAYGLTPEDAALTARGAIEAGAAGLNFEDVAGPGRLLDPQLQCERIAAMREMGDRLGVPLVINARSDAFLERIGPDDR